MTSLLKIIIAVQFVYNIVLLNRCWNQGRNVEDEDDDEKGFARVKKLLLPHFKNPCWYDVSSYEGRRLRCIPRFYVPGFGKSGTTTFCRSLAQHQDLAAPSKKELGVFDNIVDMENPIEYIMDQLPEVLDSASREIANFTTESGFHPKITYDCTPRYVWYLKLPRVIYYMYPETKLVFIIRDPVERLLSHYHHNSLLRNTTFSSSHFHNSVKLSIMEFNTCIKEKDSIKRCLHVGSDLVVQQSIYYAYIRLWAEYFPLKQMLFVKTSEMKNDTSMVMKKVFEFLELRKPSFSVMERIRKTSAYESAFVPGMYMYEVRNNVTGEKLQRSWREYRNIILPQTEKMLRNFYGPYNRRLAEYLKDTSFLF